MIDKSLVARALETWKHSRGSVVAAWTGAGMKGYMVKLSAE
jgi:hypothetical protein